MSMMDDGHCENCRWWGGERSHDWDRPWGRCRAAAPSAVIEQAAIATQKPDGGGAGQPRMVSRGEWPWVAFDDWCADWTARPSSSLATGG